MGHPLKLHPDSRCDAVSSIEVDVERTRGRMTVRYSVTGSLAAVYWPAMTESTRTDGLWQHTCFEAFIRPPKSDAYVELNLAPSTQWAAYKFDGYRKGMAVATQISDPLIKIQTVRAVRILEATVDLERLAPALASDATWQVGLSAVIEETNGRKSYWALAHPLGKPDFHHLDCFALPLTASETP
jgi:hypothetical protein